MAGRVLSDLSGTRLDRFSVGGATLDGEGLTAARNYELPDKSGIIALLSDISGGGEMLDAIPLTLTSVGQTEIEVPGGYADHAVIVVRNGSLLDVGEDYTAEDDINIVLTYPIVNLSEAVTVYRFSSFSVANTYSQAQINALLSSKQAQINTLQELVDNLPVEVSQKLVTAATNNTVTPASLFTLVIPKAGIYEISAAVRFRTAATTTGIGLGLNAATGEINAQVEIPQAAAGTASFYEGSLTASGGVILSTAALAANTDYIALIRGSYVAAREETLRVVFRSEVASSMVTVQANSYIRAREVKS